MKAFSHIIQWSRRRAPSAVCCGRGPVSVLLSALLLAFGAAAPATAAPAVKLLIEESAAPRGPWKTVDLTAAERDTDGHPVLPADTSSGFYRLMIRIAPNAPYNPTIPLDLVDKEVVERVRLHLHLMAEGGEEGWGDAELAPFVYPVYDPAFENGNRPAWLEFKVVRAGDGSVKPSGWLRNDPECLPEDRGYILYSLNPDQETIPEFDTEGETQVECLFRNAGTPWVKPIRFTPGFWAAEDGAGNLVGNLGEPSPFPGVEALDDIGRVFSANSEDGETIEPFDPRPYRFSPAQDYADFKLQWVTHPVLVEQRRLRALAIRAVEESAADPNSVIRLGPTEMRNLLDDDPIFSYTLESDEGDADQPVVAIRPQADGTGLILIGRTPGANRLEVISGTGPGDLSFRYFTIVVSDGSLRTQNTQSFTPGWQPPKQWNAAVYEETPRYWQIRRSQYCPLVGCGPVAWAMCIAWWDHKGVPAIFGNLSLADAPMGADMNGNATPYVNLRALLAELHDQCDVICNPFGDSGATPPWDMSDGIFGIGFRLYNPPYSLGPVRRSFGRAWVYPKWGYSLNDPALMAIKALKAGRVAIVGLDEINHYALAYAYKRQTFEFVPGEWYKVRRWYRCNMGWGRKYGSWYNAHDTFYGANLRFWQ